MLDFPLFHIVVTTVVGFVAEQLQMAACSYTVSDGCIVLYNIAWQNDINYTRIKPSYDSHITYVAMLLQSSISLLQLQLQLLLQLLMVLMLPLLLFFLVY